MFISYDHWIANEEISCNYEASDSPFNYGKIKEYIVTYASGIYS
jgi:hypothetical protein